ncbi:hypothetical protein TcasGA2_TC009905 [Tribolium castaneum]|uniref:Uncharacterized protein n=1 Tax=Tribolium castaneum TaxID=7070 RepID=D6WQB7_TRICA|nr:hypothetical protein TcasGA2_TC009905 [Tribolium castaneum]
MIENQFSLDFSALISQRTLAHIPERIQVSLSNFEKEDIVCRDVISSTSLLYQMVTILQQIWYSTRFQSRKCNFEKADGFGIYVYENTQRIMCVQAIPFLITGSKSTVTLPPKIYDVCNMHLVTAKSQCGVIFARIEMKNRRIASDKLRLRPN